MGRAEAGKPFQIRRLTPVLYADLTPAGDNRARKLMPAKFLMAAQ
jgi:hypothetical protein